MMSTPEAIAAKRFQLRGRGVPASRITPICSFLICRISDGTHANHRHSNASDDGALGK